MGKGLDMKNYILLAGCGFFLLSGHAPALAGNLDAEIQQKLDYIMKTEDDVEKANVRIEVEPKNVENRKGIDFSEFDTNKDGVFEKEEVGEKLFTVFDRDKNGVIDNREMKKVGLKVYSTMSKRTIETIDYHSPDKEQVKRVSEEEFIQASNLIKFDQNEDGLSPLDFLGMSFNQVNVNNHDSVIDLYEWKRAYAQTVRPLHMESFHYND